VQFPEISPFVPFLHWGDFGIRWYALAYVAGILLGWRYVVRMTRTPRLWGNGKPTMTAEQIDDLILWVTLGIILGGRIGYILFYMPKMIWTEPLAMLKIWEGGMSFHGGLIGVAVALVLFARGNKMDLLKVADQVAPAAPIGLFFGRIANFINGELWGRETTLPWGVTGFPGTPEPWVPRHPSQIYEALLEGLALFLILRFATHRALLLQRRGVVAGIFLVGYALFRLSLEWTREPDRQMFDFLREYVTMGMLLSLPMLLGGLCLIWRGMKEPVTIVAAPAEKA
jgi:phosphatidylglycerol:prolipoprotein diacylglycerol transferase